MVLHFGDNMNAYSEMQMYTFLESLIGKYNEKHNFSWKELISLPNNLTCLS